MIPAIARSISGHPLKGDRIVRLVYLDEAGIANAAHEPFVVVAGVIVNPDNTARELENQLRGIARKYVPDPYYADALIFHTTEIWHGTKSFDRKTWPLNTRLRLLRDLAAIPRLFDLPVVCGYARRDALQAEIKVGNPEISSVHMKIVEHSIAFVEAARQIEVWMRSKASSERAMLIAENTPIAKADIKRFHEGYRPYPNREDGMSSSAFHSDHIVETILFADKNESALLQIADVCAFFMRRRLMKKIDSDPFYELLHPQVVSPDRPELSGARSS